MAPPPANNFRKVEEDETPMFGIEKLNWWPTPDQGSLVSMDVGSNILLIGTSNSFVVRWNVETDMLEELIISTKKEERIHKVFIDPTGQHSLIAMKNGVAYYLHSKRDRPVLLSKVKGPVIESVGWYTHPSEPKAQHLLMGSTKGAILDLAIEDQKEKSFKRVFELGDDALISGIRIEQFPASAPQPASSSSSSSSSTSSALSSTAAAGTSGAGSSSSSSSSSSASGSSSTAAAAAIGPRYFVMVATPVRYFQFVGGPTVEALFSRYGSNLAFVELPGSLGYSELRFYRPFAGMDKPSVPDSFAWLTAAGVYYGGLSFGSQSAPGDRVVEEGNLLDPPVYPDLEAMQANEAAGRGVGDPRNRPRLSPVSMVLTEFHVLLLFKNRFVAINRLSKQPVYDRPFLAKDVGVLRGLCIDDRSDTIWAFSDRHVFEIDVNDESRDIWRVYLERNSFEEALKYCSNVFQREHVTNAQADFHFANGNYELAAKAYARTNRSFEEITLKFVGTRPPSVLLSATGAGADGGTGAGGGGGAGGAGGMGVGGALGGLGGIGAGAGFNGLGGASSSTSLSGVSSSSVLTPALAALAQNYNNNNSAGGSGGWNTSSFNNNTSSGGAAGQSKVFQAVEARSALKTYLKSKLQLLRPEDLTQLTMICSWLTEIHLDAINSLSEPDLPTLPESAAAGAAGAGGSSGGVNNFSGFMGLGGSSSAPSTLLTTTSIHMAKGAQERKVREAEDRKRELEKEVREFERFLEEYSDCLNRETTLDLLSSHGRVKELLQYASLIDDEGFILRHLTTHGKYREAVDLLAALRPDKPETSDLFYRFAPDLMASLPGRTVDALIAARGLNPVNLLPAIMRCCLAVTDLPHDPELNKAKITAAAYAASQSLARASASTSSSSSLSSSSLSSSLSASSPGAGNCILPPPAPAGECEKHAIRYLMHAAAQGHSAPALHNLLFALLLRQPTEDGLLAFVRETSRRPCYDLKFALRLCKQEGLRCARTCVELYSLQGMFHEAVRLALAVDAEQGDGLSLARDVLSSAQQTLRQNPDLLKQVWLLVMKRLVNTGKVKEALQLLRTEDCGLKLEDLLQVFPDFVKIGDLKDEVLQSLNDYNETIDALKRDMDRLTASANQIRHDIQHLAGRHGVVTANQKCDICSQPVMLRSFLVFACSHVFHSDCVNKQVKAYLDAVPARKQRVLRAKFEDSEEGVPSGYAVDARGWYALTPAQDAALVEEMGEAQCLLCSDVMIDSVQEPFVDHIAEAEEVASWTV